MHEFESRADNGSAPTRDEPHPNHPIACTAYGRKRLSAGLDQIGGQYYCPSCTPSPLAVDDAHHILRVSRRRHIIHILAHHHGEIDKARLVEHVTARETQARPRRVDTSVRKSVYIGLHQEHLPLLDAHDVIAYDDPVVNPTPRIDQLHHAATHFKTTLEATDA